jgi:hypothetical protein
VIDMWLRRYAWYRRWRGIPEPMSPRMAEITRESLRILGSKQWFK